MSGESNRAGAAPFRLSGLALELALAGKRDRVSEGVDPLGGEARIGAGGPFALDLARRERQFRVDLVGLPFDSRKIQPEVEVGDARPTDLRVGCNQFQRGARDGVAVGGEQVRGKPAVGDRSPGGVSAGSGHVQQDAEALKIAGVAPEIEPQLGRRGEVDACKCVIELAEAPLPQTGGGGGVFARLKALPLAHGRGVGDHAGELESGAGESGGEMVQRPLIVREEAEDRLDVFDGQLAVGLVGLGYRPDEAALAQHQRIYLQLEPGEGPGIQMHLDLGESQARAKGFVGPAEADVFGDNPLIPAEAQARELEVKPARAELFEHGLFDQVRQPHLVEINQPAQQHQNDQPDRHAEPAEINAANPPETMLAMGLQFCLGLGHAQFGFWVYGTER